MSGDAWGCRDDGLHIVASQGGAEVTISLVGEFDMSGSERFWSVLSEALAADPRSVVVDASRLDFIDSSGLMAFVRARDAAEEAGASLHVRSPSPALRRVVEILGLEDLLPPE
jgi:anti-sigma B factor antagonist